MPVEFSIDVPVQTNVSANVRQALTQYLLDGATVGYNWSVEQAPEDRGTLKQTSVSPERTSEGDIVWGYTQPYAEPLEFGTQPYFPPVQPLLEWSKRVTGDEGLGWYVATEKIPTEGIDEKGFARAGRAKQKDWYQRHRFSEYLD